MSSKVVPLIKQFVVIKTWLSRQALDCAEECLGIAEVHTEHCTNENEADVRFLNHRLPYTRAYPASVMIHDATFPRF